MGGLEIVGLVFVLAFGVAVVCAIFPMLVVLLILFGTMAIVVAWTILEWIADGGRWAWRVPGRIAARWRS